MKKISFIYIVLLAILSSCDSFLEEKSQDLINPKSVQDYKEFILGEAYNNGSDITPYLDVLSDDVSESVNSSTFYSNDNRVDLYGYYTWQLDAEKKFDGARKDDYAWKKFYHKILICNIIINNAADMKGDEKERKDLLAEAYFLKAYSYFMLANLYGAPYNATTASTDLCVPINNETGIEDKVFKRETVATIYKEIEDNIKKSIELFESVNIYKTKFRINKYVAYLLASRIYLFQEKYQDVIDITNKLIGVRSNLYNLNKHTGSSTFLNGENPEILFSFQKYNYKLYDSRYKRSYRASDELMALYHEKDLRISKFFNKTSNGYYPYKWKSSMSVYGQAFRLSEAYLNRAEAMAFKETGDMGLADIKYLRLNRFSEDVAIDMSDKTKAIAVIKEERRRELCFEYSRWFDLRRWEMPSFTHKYTSSGEDASSKVFTLKENDFSYTLQIPKMVTERNNTMVKNKREERE